MTYAIRCVLIAVACGVLLPGMARATDADTNVSDGPSRAELFGLRLKSDLGPNLSALGATLAQPFLIPRNTLGDAVYGIVVSHYSDENCTCKVGQACNQCKIDWRRASDQKIAFVFLKATQGSRYKDPTFEYHWRELGQHKIHRGAYHFMSADGDPVEQADHFVERIEAVGRLMPWDLPPVLDLERDLRKDASKKWIVVAETGQRLDFWQGQDPDEIVGKVLKWLNRVEQKTGRIPIIYTSRGWWMERIKDEKKFALLRRYPLWIANHAESGRHEHDSPKVPNNQPWTIWQFTDTGRMQESGIVPGNMDVNVFRGTLAAFRQAMKVSAIERDVAQGDDGKTANRAGQQMAAVSQNQASDATKSAAEPGSANAAQQAAPGTNKPTTAASAQTASAPAANKPEQRTQAQQSQQASGAAPSQVANLPNPAQPAGGNAPAQQPQQPQQPQQQTQQTQQGQQAAAQAQPPQSADKGPPAASAAGKEAAESSKPVQQAAAAKPAQTTPPAQTAETVKLAQQAAAAGANAAQGANAPSEPQKSAAAGGQKSAQVPQVAAVAPGDQKDAAKGTNPGNPAQATGGGTNQSAGGGARAPATRTAQRSTTQRAAAEKAADEKAPAEKAPADKAAGDRIMIEIELLNGRKLRVDANIDPGVLQRLISAIDK